MNNQCKYIKPTGHQCRAFAIDNSRFCFSHCPTPEIREAKHKAVINGGKSENYKTLKLDSKPVVIQNAKDVISFLNTVINELRNGQIPPKIASCNGFLINQLLRAIEINNLEQKVEILEKVIKSRQNNI
jgi:hypothetical protein